MGPREALNVVKPVAEVPAIAPPEALVWLPATGVDVPAGGAVGSKLRRPRMNARTRSFGRASK